MRLPAVLLTVLFALALSSPAHALVLAPATGCPDEQAGTPFAPWGDTARYVRVGDGGFDQGGAGWTLSNASVVDDNTPWPTLLPDAHRALDIKGSATSPGYCIATDHPSLRFFARNTGSPLSTLVVEAVFTTTLGIKLAVPVGLVLGSGEWRPSPRVLVVGNLLMLLQPGQKTRVSFRFTPVGLGARWRIDDVFVDPYAKI
ncbi:MAG TPA: hypothetical protein VNS09_19255 [Solirubrobacter sp.]|nr:hypothetical protein [Solirubrobacter sp.]